MVLCMFPFRGGIYRFPIEEMWVDENWDPGSLYLGYR